MAKKNNNTWIVAGSAVLLAVVLYLVYSYSGLLTTKTFMGNSAVVATKLDCRLTADNTLEARLTVDGSGNPAALSRGSGLQAETITWDTSESFGVITPSTSVTDEDGVAQSTFKPAAGITEPAITATFKGDRIEVDSQGNTENPEVRTIVVEYGPSSCDVPAAS